jgi:hypothetical protein
LHERFEAADAVVASLADPYNDAAFWCAAFRALRIGGRAICTLPSYEWASSFRARTSSAADIAEFVTAAGTVHSVPSLVPRLSEQVRMMEDQGFVISRYEGLALDRLPKDAHISPKLAVLDRSPLVWGFTAVRLR